MASTAQLSLFEPERAKATARGAKQQPQSSSAVLQRRNTPELTVSRLEDLVELYERQAHAERTRAIYQSDWSLFERWCVARGFSALPTSTETLCQYLAFMAGELGRKASTIRRARCSIGLAHAHAGLPRPDAHARVRALERGIGRTHGARAEGAQPLLQEHLAPVVRRLGSDARDVRDRALILLGFAGAYRAGDLVRLDIEHLTFSAGFVRVLLLRSKEDQLGEGAHTDIPSGMCIETCPVDALRAWIGRVGRPAGPLFRGVSGPRIEHQRISTRCVSRAVQRATERAGLDGHFSAHSLRSGLATSAYASGATEREIQAHGRWKDRRSLDRYIHVSRMPGRTNVASGLF
jgi:integrase